jgi:hypothetical protein
MLPKQEEEHELSQDELIVAYTQTKSLNKTCEAVFGKGKKGAYYINKVKPVLIAKGLYEN